MLLFLTEASQVKPEDALGAFMRGEQNFSCNGRYSTVTSTSPTIDQMATGESERRSSYFTWIWRATVPIYVNCHFSLNA